MSKNVLGVYDLTETSFSSGACLTLVDGPLELGWRHSGLTSDFIAEAMALPRKLGWRSQGMVATVACPGGDEL